MILAMQKPRQLDLVVARTAAVVVVLVLVSLSQTSARGIV